MGEECDDNNLESGDGCSQLCRIEYGFACAVISHGNSVVVDSATEQGKEILASAFEWIRPSVGSSQVTDVAFQVVPLGGQPLDFIINAISSFNDALGDQYVLQFTFSTPQVCVGKGVIRCCFFVCLFCWSRKRKQRECLVLEERCPCMYVCMQRREYMRAMCVRACIFAAPLVLTATSSGLISLDPGASVVRRQCHRDL